MGVYTSIFDLTSKGLHWHGGATTGTQFRLNLVKLDSNSGPLGTWTGPEFTGIEDDLQEYVGTGEFSEQEVEGLVNNLRAFVKQAV